MADVRQASRFAIYFSPKRDQRLFELGSQWLGRDAASEADLDPALAEDLSIVEWKQVTESPRRYGFHATLKPPFRLAKNVAYEDLRSVLRDYAKKQRRFEV